MFEVHVRNERQDQRLSHAEGLLVIGRAPEGEGRQLVIEDLRVSRRQLQVELRAEGRIRVENFGKALRFEDGSTLERGGVQELSLPASLRVGHTTLSFSSGASELRTIAPPATVAGAVQGQQDSPSVSNLASLGESPAPV